MDPVAHWTAVIQRVQWLWKGLGPPASTLQYTEVMARISKLTRAMEAIPLFSPTLRVVSFVQKGVVGGFHVIHPSWPVDELEGWLVCCRDESELRRTNEMVIAQR
jgi:hypothetical protein